jgi:hypothetical protein
MSSDTDLTEVVLPPIEQKIICVHEADEMNTIEKFYNQDWNVSYISSTDCPPFHVVLIFEREYPVKSGTEQIIFQPEKIKYRICEFFEHIYSQLHLRS